jgi:hypothetical protein
MNKLRLLSAVLFGFAFICCNQKQNNLQHWPDEASPEVIGKKVSERFLVTPHGKYNSNDKAHIPYFEVCTWYGALTYAEESSDTVLAGKLAQRFEPLFSTEASLLPESNHVDFNVFGALALELFLQTQTEKYKII